MGRLLELSRVVLMIRWNMDFREGQDVEGIKEQDQRLRKGEKAETCGERGMAPIT